MFKKNLRLFNTSLRIRKYGLVVGRQNGPGWAGNRARRAHTGDVGQEPCPESGAQPHLCLMEGENVCSPLSLRVTHQDTAVIGSLRLITVRVWLWFPGTQVSKIRTACWHPQQPKCRCAAISRLLLLAHEIPEAGDLNLRLRAWGSVMKHRGMLCTRPIFLVLLFFFFQELWFRKDVRVGIGKVPCTLVFPGRKGLQPPAQILEQ